jgi:hypothetical protein
MKYNGTPFNHWWKDQSIIAWQKSFVQQTAAANNPIQLATTKKVSNNQQRNHPPCRQLKPDPLPLQTDWWWQLRNPQGQVQVFINRCAAARALALRNDMHVYGATLDLLEEGIASVVDGHYGTFMHCQFEIVRLVVANDGDGGDDSDKGNEEARPSPVPSLRVIPPRK